MRLEAEFTSEPFHGEGSPPEHAVAARDAAAEAGLETDFGPLGTLARGDAEKLLEAVPAIARAAFGGGATRVTLQLRRADNTEPDDGGNTSTTGSATPSDRTNATPHTGTTRSATPHDRTNATPHTGTTQDAKPGAGAAEAGPPGTAGAPAVELNDALARLIADVERELGAGLGELDRPGKQRAVRLLRERGAFGLRKSVSSVADALGVTRFTVYNYLNREPD